MRSKFETGDIVAATRNVYSPVSGNIMFKKGAIGRVTRDGVYLSIGPVLIKGIGYDISNYFEEKDSACETVDELIGVLCDVIQSSDLVRSIIKKVVDKYERRGCEDYC